MGHCLSHLQVTDGASRVGLVALWQRHAPRMSGNVWLILWHSISPTGKAKKA